MLNFGNRLKALREQKSLKQSQLAERLEVSKAVICAYETGIRYPSLEMLVKLAYSFNVTTDYLLGISKNNALDVTGLTPEQVGILSKISDEFKK